MCIRDSDSSGRLLLGVNSASGYSTDEDNFIIKGSAEVGMHIIGGTSSTTAINFGDGTGTSAYRGKITYHNADDSMRFNTAASEGMRITSTGNVGIGTTSTQHTGLTVAGDNGILSNITGSYTNGIVFSVHHGNSAGMTVMADSASGQLSLIHISEPTRPY